MTLSLVDLEMLSFRVILLVPSLTFVLQRPFVPHLEYLCWGQRSESFAPAATPASLYSS